MTSLERHGVSNHRHTHCLFDSLFTPATNYQSSIVLALCEGNHQSSLTKDKYAESVPMPWRHDVSSMKQMLTICKCESKTLLRKLNQNVYISLQSKTFGLWTATLFFVGIRLTTVSALIESTFKSLFQENAFENVVCKMSTVLLRHQCV